MLFFGCQKDIEEYYYENTEETVDTDIYSLLKENEDYSQFVALLKEYQVDTLLDKGNIYTFFVPDNDAMDNIGESMLGDKELVEYLMTESYVNLNNIETASKIQTLSGKFAFIERLGNSSYTFDGVNIVKGSPLTNNGRYYQIENVAKPKPSLYQYIAETNEFYRSYLDSRDSIFLDKELSTPIGYTDDGSTIYDTVLTVINRFEMNYFPVTEEFRDYKATMLLFTQEQYDNALLNISNEINVPVSSIPEVWENEVLMPYLLEQSVFRNALSFSLLSAGRVKNILGDSVDVEPENINPDFFECSNGSAYNYIDFKVPEHLYKVQDSIAMSSLLEYKGTGIWAWGEDVTIPQDAFSPVSVTNGFSTFGDVLLVDMGKNYEGDFYYAYNHQFIFPATYKLTVRANLSKTGVYNIYVNDKQYPVDINDGNGPQYDFDFFDLRNGVISSVTNEFYPFENNFCSFDIFVDNITEFGDVEVRIEYVEPSTRNKNNCGLVIDFISLDYYNENN